MHKRVYLPLAFITIVVGSSGLFLLSGCDGELSDGLPEVIESSGDSCNTCHKSPPSPPHPSDERCYACHPETVGSDGQTIAGGAHLNEKVDVAMVNCDICHGFPPAAPHPAVTVCAPCHEATFTDDGSIDKEGGMHANGTVNVAITADACSLCHGYPPAAPHPQSDGCVTCHKKTVDADNLLLEGSDKHLNGQVDLLVDGASCDACHGFPPVAPHPEEGSCANCHAATVNDSGEVKGSKHLNGQVDLKLTDESCGGCHAMPPEGDHPPADDCGECHGCVVDDELKFVNEDLHMNGKTNFGSPPDCP